ncbi:hypothetical protein NDU88_004389 [Pleurodeles waltl]|uniref:Uncharacterized protein n=1 Tax=Pleurodeles waltl TaxID=8319 RepID=A0AAV7W9L2_PLEWA|nr:hypothetical protein NDU88_004389 [Pleurodeles waltl]
MRGLVGGGGQQPGLGSGRRRSAAQARARAGLGVSSAVPGVCATSMAGKRSSVVAPRVAACELRLGPGPGEGPLKELYNPAELCFCVTKDAKLPYCIKHVPISDFPDSLEGLNDKLASPKTVAGVPK